MGARFLFNGRLFHRRTFLVNGSKFSVYGSIFLVHGSMFLVNLRIFLVHGSMFSGYTGACLRVAFEWHLTPKLSQYPPKEHVTVHLYKYCQKEI